MVKRTFDIVLSVFALGLFLPFAFLLSIVIFLEDKGTIFYLQERVGLHGKLFKLIKFRTMKANSDKKGKLTVGMKDTRITKIGFYLRKFKLDEFPQFINVLKGEMSIIGPRPEVQEFVDLYSEDQREILKVKPGITDFASIEYFEENKLLGESSDPKKTYVEEIMPKKIELNKKYIQNPTLLNDFKIIYLTLKKMITS